MSIDHRLSDQLHALVDPEPGSAPPTRVLLERGRRARRRRTATLAGVTVAATVAVAAATGFVALRPAPDRLPVATDPVVTTQADASTPQLRLAAALAATGSTSYAFTISMVPKAVDGVTLTDEDRELLATSRTATGEFDPATSTGVLRYGDGSEQRLVNGERFVGGGSSDRWKKQADGRHDTLTFSGLGNDPIAVSSDPTQLLKTIRDAGSVTEVSPDVYRFETRGPVGQPAPGTKYDQPGYVTTGEITVRDGKVAKVAYLSPLLQGGPAPHVRAAVTVEFSDYGKTVTVQKPQAWVD